MMCKEIGCTAPSVISGFCRAHYKPKCNVCGSTITSGKFCSMNCKIVHKKKQRSGYFESNPLIRENIYKLGASKRNIDYSLTHEQFMSLWQKPCHYCGDDIRTIGIDRVDNDKGYKIDNVVSCCNPCNMMKRNSPYNEFVERCKRISENTFGVLTNKKIIVKLNQPIKRS